MWNRSAPLTLALAGLIVSASAQTSTAGHAYWTGPWMYSGDPGVSHFGGEATASLSASLSAAPELGEYAGRGLEGELQRTFRVTGDTEVDLSFIAYLSAIGERFPRTEASMYADIGVLGVGESQLYRSWEVPPYGQSDFGGAFDQSFSLASGDYTFSIQLGVSTYQHEFLIGYPSISGWADVDILGIAIPEPSSLALCSLGLGVVGVVVRRRRNA